MITREKITASFKSVPLGEAVEFLDYLRRPVKEESRTPGPYPYYGANGQQGTIDRYLFDEDIILLAEDGGHFENPSRGIAYFVSGKCWVNNHAHVLRPKSGFDIRFLTRVLENYNVVPFVTGTTRGKLTQAGAAKIPIPLLPLDYQRRIAAILDQADVLRERRRKAVERASRLAQAIFISTFGDWSRPNHGIPLVKLGPNLDFLTSGSRGWAEYYRDAGSLFLRIQNVRYDELDLTDIAYVSPPHSAEARRTRVQPGDVLLSITADLGRTAVVPKEIGEAYINQHLALIRTRAFDPRFLSAALASPAGQKIIRSKNREAVKAGMNFDDIKSIEVPDVSREAQCAFARSAAKAGAILYKAREHLAATDQLFLALQNQLFGDSVPTQDLKMAAE